MKANGKPTMLKKLTQHSFFRFLLIGVCNTIVGMGTMLILYNFFSVSYWASSACNYIIGSILSYFLNKRFTFRNTDHAKKSISRFVIHILLCYLISYGLAKQLALYLLIGYSVSVQDNAAMLAGSCVFVLLNYFGQKVFVFRSRAEQ